MMLFSLKRFGVLAGVVLVGPSAHAADIDWTNGGTFTDWSDANNWDSGVPGATDNATVSGASLTLTTSPQILTGTEYVDFLLLGTDTGEFGGLTLNGGTLDVSTRVYLGGTSTTNERPSGGVAEIKVIGGGELLAPYVGLTDGKIIQTGGNVEVDQVGTLHGLENDNLYELSGGTLTTERTTLFAEETTTFYQSGGTHTTDFLEIGDVGALGSGLDVTYEMDGGLLFADNIAFGNKITYHPSNDYDTILDFSGGTILVNDLFNMSYGQLINATSSSTIVLYDGATLILPDGFDLASSPLTVTELGDSIVHVSGSGNLVVPNGETLRGGGLTDNRGIADLLEIEAGGSINVGTDESIQLDGGLITNAAITVDLGRNADFFTGTNDSDLYSGTTLVSESVTVENGGTLTATSATFEKDSGSPTAVNIAAGGELYLDGSEMSTVTNFGLISASNNVDIDPGAILNYGQLVVSDTTDDLTLITPLFLNDGQIEFSIDGASANSFDKLIVDGTLKNHEDDSELVIDLDGSYTPTIGGSFEIIDADEFGTQTDYEEYFASVTNINYGAGDDGQFLLEYDLASTQETLTLLVVDDGDVDGSGIVSQSDIDIIAQNWGTNVVAGGLSSGDLTGDGFVAQGDLDKVLQNWGGAGTPDTSGIPEPGTLAAGVLLGLGLLRRRAA